MKKTLLTKTLLLLFALIAGSSSSWATDDITGTINFGNAAGSTQIKGASSSGEGTVTYTDTGNDSQGNTWTITTVSSTGKSFTQNASYSQVGAAKKPATSITFTTTLPSSQTIKAFSAKFGGFSDTAGDVTLKVGDTTVGSGSLDGTNDVTVSATNTTTAGTVLTVTVTNIAKGVKCYYISYTYESSALPSNATFENKTPSVDWPTNTTYTQAATTAAGYTGAVTYAIGGTNTCEATINASTGEVSFTKGGTVVVNATAAEVAGQFTQSSDSYTLTINDVRATATLSWSESSVEIFKDAASYTLPTLNNPNSLDVTYTVEGTTGLASVTSEGVVTVNTSTVGTATVKASFAGNNSYKPKTATYTINVVDPTVKGSKYNPYTVAEVIAAAPSSTSTPASGEGDVYVIGYIVGGYNSSSIFTTTSSEFQASNIALADDPSNTSSNIPVQMPNNAIRSNFNVADNPYHVGSTQVLLKGDILKYFSKPGIKNVDEMTATAIDITIGTSGYTTLGRNFDLDHLKATPTDGLEAYVVTAVSASSVTLEAIPHIPAGTGVILKGTPETTYTIPVYQHGYTVSTNLLKVSDGTITGGDGIYALASKGDPAVVGFYKVAAGVTIPAGKCYLNTVAGAPDFLGFGGDATGIDEVRGKTEEVRGEFYNLAGQRVAQPTKGLYIVNGKKVVMK